MTELTTAKGHTLLCDSVTRSQQFMFLYIHTKALSWAEAETFFSDPEDMAELKAVETFTFPAINDEGKEEMVTASQERVYRRFTELYCVQKSPLVEGALMIWLQRPESED